MRYKNHAAGRRGSGGFAPVARRANPPPIRITDRDRALLRLVFERRVIARADAHAHVGVPEKRSQANSSVAHRLRTLFQNGFLHAPARPSGVYALAPRGAGELRKMVGEDTETLRALRGSKWGRLPRPIFLEHQLAVTRILSGVEASFRALSTKLKMPYEPEILSYDAVRRCGFPARRRVSLGRGQWAVKHYKHTADGIVFVPRFDGGKRTWARDERGDVQQVAYVIEYESGANLRQLDRRLRPRYQSYQRHFTDLRERCREQGMRNPFELLRIVTVLERERDLERMVEMARSIHSQHGRPWRALLFTTMDFFDRMPSLRLFSPIFQAAYSEDPVSIYRDFLIPAEEEWISS